MEFTPRKREHYNPDAATEPEVQEWLAHTVRAIRPLLVVETGCYYGDTTWDLALACLDNGIGKVVTCDTQERYVERVRNLVRGLPCTVELCRGVDLPALRDADFLFLDSDFANRRPEFDLVKTGALVVIHDTRVSFDGALPPHGEWVLEQGGILFPSPRGFGVVRKR